MDDDRYDGFYDMDQLLMEEGLIASNTAAPETWAHNLVREVGKDLTDAQKTKVVYQLLGLKEHGKLPWGIQTKIAKELNCHKSTICKIFKRAEKQRARGEAVDVSNKKKGHCGRKSFNETQ